MNNIYQQENFFQLIIIIYDKSVYCFILKNIFCLSFINIKIKIKINFIISS